jgi:hypothetical protein
MFEGSVEGWFKSHAEAVHRTEEAIARAEDTIAFAENVLSHLYVIRGRLAAIELEAAELMARTRSE